MLCLMFLRIYLELTELKMSKFEERLKERVPDATDTLRKLMVKYNIINENMSDEEICSLQTMFSIWEAAANNTYEKHYDKAFDNLVDVKNIGEKV